MGYDDDNAVPPSSGPGSGSADSIERIARAALDGWEASNRAAGQRFMAAHKLMIECVAHPDCCSDAGRPGYSVVDAGVMAASHLVRMFPISAYKAESMLSFAADLHFRYPAILEAMLAGRMDETTARALGEQMSHVDQSVLDQVQREVVEDYLAAIAAGERPGMKAVRKRADELISARDPNAVRERMSDAGRERGARISRARDGMAHLYALLHADEAAVLAEALDAKVAADKAAEEDAAAARAAAPADTDGAGDADPTGSGFGPESGDELYSEEQRLADALMSLACGDATVSTSASSTGTETETDTDTDSADDTNSTDSGATDSGATGPGPAGVPVTLRPKVTVIVPGGDGDWADRARVEFARTGEAALQALLEMLASSDGASLQRIDPTIAADDDPAAALRYRPGTTLANRIRLRDGGCRHPGCTAPIEACELDHVVPFDHDDPANGGLTVEENMAGLCRKHHRYKTFNDWDYRLEPDGTLIITTPEGKTMLTRPHGPLAAFRREQARVEDDSWKRQQRRSPDPGRTSAGGRVDPSDHVEQSSWARREDRKRARREQQRAQNAVNRAANAARREQEKEQAGQQARDAERSTNESGLGSGFVPVRVSLKPDTFDVPTHRRSRWWHNNHHRYPATTRSPLEKALDAVLAEHLDPPPF